MKEKTFQDFKTPKAASKASCQRSAQTLVFKATIEQKKNVFFFSCFWGGKHVLKAEEKEATDLNTARRAATLNMIAKITKKVKIFIKINLCGYGGGAAKVKEAKAAGKPRINSSNIDRKSQVGQKSFSSLLFSCQLNQQKVHMLRTVWSNWKEQEAKWRFRRKEKIFARPWASQKCSSESSKARSNKSTPSSPSRKRSKRPKWRSFWQQTNEQ